MKILVSSAVGITITAFSSVFAFAKANPMEVPVTSVIEAKTIAKLPEVTVKTEAGLRIAEPTVRPIAKPTAMPEPTAVPVTPTPQPSTEATQPEPTPTAAPVETTPEPEVTAAPTPVSEQAPVAQAQESAQDRDKTLLGLGVKIKLSL